jgi:DNA polymerase (family 10)
VDKRSVAQGLEQIAALLELRGENPFRVRAFRTAAKAVAALSSELGDHLADGSLAATKGVGPATLQIVQELASTGRSSLLEELRGQVPPGLVEMLQISGLGVAKVRQLHEALGIDSLPELEAAARDGRLAKLPRFGARTAENILKSIAFLRQASAFRLAHHAAEEAEALRSTLAALPGVTEAVIAGEVRRRMEVVRETAIVVVASVPPGDLLRPIGEMPGVQEISGQDERRATLKIEGGAHAQVVVTTPKNVGAVLVQATGGAEHLAALAAHARNRGFSLDGAALWHGNTFVPTPDETSLYQALGLAYIPPEIREGQGEIDAAATSAIPALIQREDLQGFLHCHTVASDGSNSVEELAQACLAAGYRWVGVTDHSKTAAYAGGLSADDLARQADEIEALNQRLDGIRILKGIEADILVDGALDYDNRVLSRLDFVIGSIHSRFNLDRETMTARMLAAIDNPYLTILGHPTGRLLLSRDPYPIDMERVIEKAGQAGVAIEINADPHRLDLDWRLLRQARQAGVMISIGADAHSLAGLGNVDFGIGIARKGWLVREDVLNTRPVEGFLAFAQARRGR